MQPPDYSNFNKSGDGVGTEDDGQQGCYVIPSVCTPDKAAGLTMTSGLTKYVRWRPQRMYNVVSIGFTNTTAAGANDNCDAGIWDPISGLWVCTAGATAGKLNATAGAQFVNMSTQVQVAAGKVYYVAFACGTLGSTGAVLASLATPLANTHVTEMFGAAFPSAELSTSTGGTGLAALTPTYSTTAVAPLLCVREI